MNLEAAMSVRAKFKVSAVTAMEHSTVVKLGAVCADEVPENQRYHKHTPAGSLEITVTNPAAANQFAPGKVFYLDFTETV